MMSCRPSVFDDLRKPKEIGRYHAAFGSQPQKSLINIGLSETRVNAASEAAAQGIDSIC
jgi:hypothetical protein